MAMTAMSKSAMGADTVTTTPMHRCWCTRAGIAGAVPLGLAGVLLARGLRAESRGSLALLAGTPGVVGRPAAAL